MNKVLWKSLGLILILLLVLIGFLWYSKYKLTSGVESLEVQCQQQANTETSKSGTTDVNGIAVPSQEAYQAAYEKCMQQFIPPAQQTQ